MHLLPRAIQAVATLNCLAVLSACGGGGDATPEQKSAVDASVTTEYQVMAVVNGQQLRVGTFTASNLQTYPEHLWSEILQRQ